MTQVITDPNLFALRVVTESAGVGLYRQCHTEGSGEDSDLQASTSRHPCYEEAKQLCQQLAAHFSSGFWPVNTVVAVHALMRLVLEFPKDLWALQVHLVKPVMCLLLMSLHHSKCSLCSVSSRVRTNDLLIRSPPP